MYPLSIRFYFRRQKHEISKNYYVILSGRLLVLSVSYVALALTAITEVMVFIWALTGALAQTAAR